MTDRDTFAAAALTGMLDKSDAANPENIAAWWPEVACAAAYRWADAMLAVRDSRTADTPPPHATPPQGSVPDEGSVLDSREWNEPVAWATFYPNGSTASVYIGRVPSHAAPLYRQPQPTLTDEEREAVKWYAAYGRGNHADTLRKLLERLA